jgi:hypothetical protein
LPSDGLIETNADGLKLGVWLMPDNQSRGMLETFLMYLAPQDNDAVLRYAAEACRTAKEMGAPFKEAQTTKAEIHTWLAWQDEPGRQLHQAVKERLLNPNAPYARPFLNWFRKLFEV